MSNLKQTLRPIILGLATLFCASVAAQQTVAVNVTNRTNGTLSQMDLVKTSFAEAVKLTKGFQVKDNVVTAGVLKGTNLLGVDKNRMKEIGSMLKVDYVYLADMTNLRWQDGGGWSFDVEASLFSAKTGEKLATKNVSFDNSDSSDVIKSTSRALADSLTKVAKPSITGLIDDLFNKLR